MPVARLHSLLSTALAHPPSLYRLADLSEAAKRVRGVSIASLAQRIRTTLGCCQLCQRTIVSRAALSVVAVPPLNDGPGKPCVPETLVQYRGGRYATRLELVRRSSQTRNARASGNGWGGTHGHNLTWYRWDRRLRPRFVQSSDAQFVCELHRPALSWPQQALYPRPGHGRFRHVFDRVIRLLVSSPVARGSEGLRDLSHWLLARWVRSDWCRAATQRIGT
jgi:hypothetical protein